VTAVLRDTVGMEWIKFRTVRSTYWTLLVAVVASIGIAALVCSVYVARYDHLTLEDKLTFNPTRFSLSGLSLAQLAVGVLGALVVTNEYSTGMIRATLSAVPQRPVVLAAKCIVFGAVILVLGEVLSFAGYFLGQAILSDRHLESHIGDPGVLRTVIGGGLYLVVLGLLAVGLGALIRRTAGAIAALFGLILVLPGIVAALPQSWQDAISKWLPSNAGEALLGGGRHFGGGQLLSPWVGFAVFCAYAAAFLLAAGVLLQRRDA
jgi:ABC-2 type transport system permease protein